MEIYKILVIGNSFGEDATHFLHDLALTRGINTKVVNLYIGGCSLEHSQKKNGIILSHSSPVMTVAGLTRMNHLWDG